MNIYILLTFFKVFWAFFPLFLGQMFHMFMLTNVVWIVSIRPASYQSYSNLLLMVLLNLFWFQIAPLVQLLVCK